MARVKTWFSSLKQPSKWQLQNELHICPNIQPQILNFCFFCSPHPLNLSFVTPSLKKISMESKPSFSSDLIKISPAFVFQLCTRTTCLFLLLLLGFMAISSTHAIDGIVQPIKQPKLPLVKNERTIPYLAYSCG